MKNLQTISGPENTIISESRAFQVHQNILTQLIHNQGQSETEAFRELIQNSIDAKATYCKIWINQSGFTIEDDGIGFSSKEAIISTFEVFGQPHLPGERESSFKRFRIGRGQIMAFARTVWQSGPFSMYVDIENNGFNYTFTEDSSNKNFIEGCRIVGEWNASSSINCGNLEYTLLRTIGLITQIAIYINDRQVTLSRFWITPDLETEDFLFFRWQTISHNVLQVNERLDLAMKAHADLEKERAIEYIGDCHEFFYEHLSDKDKCILLLEEFSCRDKLRVYNMGVWVADMGIWEGLLITKKGLNLTSNRNAIQWDCPVWNRVEASLSEWTRATLPGQKLTALERNSILIDAFYYPDNYLTEPFFAQPLFFCRFNDTWYSLDTLLSGTAAVTFYEEDYHSLLEADRIHQQQKAIVLNADGYDRVKSKTRINRFSTYFLKLLKELVKGCSSKDNPKNNSANKSQLAVQTVKIQGLIERTIELQTLILQYKANKELLENKALTVYQYAAWRALDDVVGYGKGYTTFSIKKRIFNALVLGDQTLRSKQEWKEVKENWNKALNRDIKVGWCSTESAWTDSYSYIALHSDELEKLKKGLVIAHRLLLLYYHELAHHPLNPDTHNQEFYETFHRLVLSYNEDLLVKPAFTLLNRFAYYLYTQQVPIPEEVERDLLSGRRDGLGLSRKNPAERRWHDPLKLLAGGRIAPIWYKTDPELINCYLIVWNDNRGISYLLPKSIDQKPIRLSEFIENKVFLEKKYTSRVHTEKTAKEAKSKAQDWLTSAYARKKKATLVCLLKLNEFLGEIRLCPSPSGKPLPIFYYRRVDANKNKEFKLEDNSCE